MKKFSTLTAKNTPDKWNVQRGQSNVPDIGNKLFRRTSESASYIQ